MGKRLDVAVVNYICPACADKSDSEILIGKRFVDEQAETKLDELSGQNVGYRWCERCAAARDQGAVFLVEIDPAQSKVEPNGHILPENAYRTGRLWGITEAAFHRAFNSPITKGRIVFIDPEVTEKLGLDAAREISPEIPVSEDTQ